MVNYTEILFIPKTTIGFQDCHRIGEGYRINSSEGEIPWLSKEEKIIAQTPKHRADNTFDLVTHFSKVLGVNYEDELMRYVTNETKTLRDLRLELDGRSVSRGLYLNVKHKSLSLRCSTENFRQKLKEVVSRLSEDIKIKWSSINVKSEVTKLYVATWNHLKTYHEIESGLIHSGHLNLNDILSRKKFEDKAIYLKAFLKMKDDFTVVEFLICDSEIHPYAEYNFTTSDRIDCKVIQTERYNSRLSRQVLGYDSPKNREDVIKIARFI